MSEKIKIIYYSLLSGDIYEVYDDETEGFDEYQIPLTQYPKKNCRSCYGRGYIGYDRQKKYHPMCRCIATHIDKDKLAEVNIKY